MHVIWIVILLEKKYGLEVPNFRVLLDTLSQDISLYCLAFILPLMKAISPTPLKGMHLQIIICHQVLQLVSSF